MSTKRLHLKTQKSHTAPSSSRRPMLSLGHRPKRQTATCIICDKPKLVHRSGVKTCSVKCRVAWHRLTPTGQAELIANQRKADELALAD